MKMIGPKLSQYAFKGLDLKLVPLLFNAEKKIY